MIKLLRATRGDAHCSVWYHRDMDEFLPYQRHDSRWPSNAILSTPVKGKRIMRKTRHVRTDRFEFSAPNLLSHPPHKSQRRVSHDLVIVDDRQGKVWRWIAKQGRANSSICNASEDKYGSCEANPLDQSKLQCQQRYPIKVKPVGIDRSV